MQVGDPSLVRVAAAGRAVESMGRHSANPSGGFVMVRVDDSPGPCRAVFWAAQEAARRSASLHMVSSYAPPRGNSLTDHAKSADYAAERSVALEQRHRELLADLVTVTPAIGVATSVEQGHPIDVLLDAADAVELVVMSTRHRYSGGMRLTFPWLPPSSRTPTSRLP
jgi:nucleotide-binding universal stress UspA family protein